ncbi:hypothetical protein GCM10010912_02660 [Paenibacillus albidus]|uniref:Uncharacterized protein n=1 Tax=Paenibacillus albidus TaxID=2041023 RepID=A0A917BW13_9BACL|nr:hypothetical protein GCM10010912_02660 [Paenibacillus albidus]
MYSVFPALACAASIYMCGKTDAMPLETIFLLSGGLRFKLWCVISQNEQTWGEAIIRTLLSLVQEEEIGEFIDTGITRQLAP